MLILEKTVGGAGENDSLSGKRRWKMVSVSGSPAERTSLSECLLCIVFNCSQSLFLTDAHMVL